jgi:hypothetical protein
LISTRVAGYRGIFGVFQGETNSKPLSNALSLEIRQHLELQERMIVLFFMSQILTIDGWDRLIIKPTMVGLCTTLC